MNRGLTVVLQTVMTIHSYVLKTMNLYEINLCVQNSQSFFFFSWWICRNLGFLSSFVWSTNILDTSYHTRCLFSSFWRFRNPHESDVRPEKGDSIFLRNLKTRIRRYYSERSKNLQDHYLNNNSTTPLPFRANPKISVIKIFFCSLIKDITGIF